MTTARRAAVTSALALALGCSPPPPHDAAPDSDATIGGDGFTCADGAVAPAGDAACPVRREDQSACMELTVGTGRDGTFEEFRPLRDGDSVVLTPGAQGLQHVVVALRGSGFEPTLPLWEAVVVRADDCVEVGRQRYRFPFAQDPYDPTRMALRAVQLVITDGDRVMADRLEYCTILGRDVVIVVDFDDVNGRRAHREVRVHVSGIDPNTRPDIRQAWIDACARRDGGAGDAAADAEAGADAGG